MADLGVSFIPSGDEGQQQGAMGPGAAPGVPPLQSAIRLLSMRLPRFGGGMSPASMAPGALLGGQGGAAMGGAGSLEAMLRALFGLGGPAGAPSMGAPPMPKIVPGEGPGRVAAPGDGTIPGGFKPQPTFQPSPAPGPMVPGGGPKMPRFQSY